MAGHVFAFQFNSGLHEGQPYIERLQCNRTNKRQTNRLDLLDIGWRVRSNGKFSASRPAVSQESVGLRAGSPVVDDVEGVTVDELLDSAALQS